MSIIHDFHDRHGPDFIQVDGWLLWPNGAYRENNAYGLLADPPPEPHECAKRVLRYWEIKTERTVAEFDRVKHELKCIASCAMRDGANVPDDDALDKLKELQAEVAHCSEELEKAEAAVEGTTPEEWKQRRAIKEKKQAEGAKFAEKLRKISV